MLEQVLTHIHNWFRVRDSVDGIHPGEYTIQDGQIALPFLRDGQYFRIMGSVFNDGLHRYQALKSPEGEAPADDIPAEGLEESAPEEPPGTAPNEPDEASDLADETFDGTIWALAIPRDVEALAAEMEEWETKNGAKAAGMYQSESYAGYSYSKYTNGHGSPINVLDVFRARLNPYRKLREV